LNKFMSFSSIGKITKIVW